MLYFGDLISLPTIAVRDIRGEDGASWPAHEVIEGKPQKQFMGPAGQKLSISLFLHIDFILPRPTITALRELQGNGSVFALTTVSGAEWGTYVIESVSHSIISALPDGRVICARCELSLGDPGYDVPPRVDSPTAVSGTTENTTTEVPTEDTSRPLDEVLAAEILRI